MTFAALLALALGAVAGSVPASAQNTTGVMHFPPRPPPPPRQPAPPSNAPMLVQATEIRYDYTNNSVAAVGNVQIYYGGATVEADQLIYDQKTKRLRAEGNVRLTEPDGKITYGQVIELTDDYRDGFVDSLRLETADDARFAAARADRAGGNYTVLQNGVYTACEPCKDDPRKPPLWQVKAARIIHDEGEKMLYFEDARIEFFGVPLAYVPFMSAPDLFPNLSQTTQYGFGIEPKYFWALAPNDDLTLSTLLTTRQRALFKGEWRHRLLDGSYSIRAAGIFQQDPGYLAARDGANSPTAGTFRGAIQTAGQFAIKWTWGCTGASLKLTANWVLLGSTRYDIENDRFDQARLGVGYVDDCFMLSVNWLSSYTYTTVAAPVRNDTVMLQFSLRTLGPDALAQVDVSY